jgi:hypothetical protein
MKTLTLTDEQLDLMLAMARDVERARCELARTEHLHGMASGDKKRRLYRDLYAARKHLANCELALSNMRRHVGAEEAAS